jgi:Ca-activated chloride channel family protein
LGALAGALLLCAGLQAQQQTFRADVRAVAVYATVRDGSGHLVPDLDRDAFQVFEDGRPRQIAVFSRDPQPLSVAIMLDTSASMPGWQGREQDRRIAPAVRAFLRGLRPEDRASIGTFGLEVAVGANLTNDRAELARVLEEEVWTGGGTPLWQALRAAMTSLSGEHGRRVVLVVTDGLNTGSVPGRPGGRSGAERQAVEQDCMVYAVGFEASLRERLPDNLRSVIATTGGGHFVVPRGVDPARSFEQLAEELRHQYLLGFIPIAADGEVHRMEIRMTRPNLTASARTSFVAPLRP